MRPALALLAFLAWGRLTGTEPCRLEVVDREDGWPVPGVELRTTHGVRFVTDNAGLIAFDLPELMNRETWLGVIGHGYEVKADGFGHRGFRLTPTPGKALRLEVTRTIPARRLGRLTGAGLFAESQKLGEHLDATESGVLGCDSVVCADYQGKLHWFWGDTILAHYPLGIFNVSAATTHDFIPPARPPLRVAYDYFTTASAGKTTSRPRGVAEVPGEGPTWIWGAITLPDAQGAPHLVATAVKVKGEMEAYRWDLVEWHDDTQIFRPLSTVWTKDKAHPAPPPLPEGHAVRWTDANGRAWVLFCDPFPTLRCPATYEAWKDPKTWEPLPADKHVTAENGKQIEAHRGHIAWHPWSKKWLVLFTQKGGSSSFLGEIWLAEADAPTGPWNNARKVATHENYTFYNPVLHPEFFRDDSPVIHFEGTYTATFSGNHQPTPRWDYNQVLYQLDLSKPPFAAKK